MFPLRRPSTSPAPDEANGSMATTSPSSRTSWPCAMFGTLLPAWRRYRSTECPVRFRPIRNLTGHSVERYLLHAGKSVPNIAHGHDVLEEGEVVAIEPFASSGAGEVDGRRTGNIYRVVRTKPTKQPELNDFLAVLSREFKTLPFAERWAFRIEPRTPTLLNSLLRTGAVMSYPALLDLGNGIVSQTEHTMIVGSGGAEVTTA